jgi:hypothetical protein
MNEKQREAAKRLIDDRLMTTMEWRRQVIAHLRAHGITGEPT